MQPRTASAGTILFTTVLLVPLAAGIACASVTPPSASEPATQDAPPAAESAQSTAASEAAAGRDFLTPPDGNWLVDENGSQYYVKKEPKIEGAYMRLEEKGKIRLLGGVTFDLLEEDDEYFYVKVYRPQAPPPAPPPSTETLASYLVQPPTTDRLRFVPFQEGLPDEGQWRNGFAVADVDADGHLDIIHPPPRKAGTQPVIFLGDGEGSWRFWDQARFEGPALDYGTVTAADFNRDGHLDLAFGVHLRGVIVMVGDGRGRFTPWSEGIEYSVPGGGGAPAMFSSKALKVVDWNEDGWPDLLALGEGPRLSRSGRRGKPEFERGSQGPVLFVNQGDGSWKRQDQGTGRKELYGDHIALGDFNGDGRRDFATASNVGGRQDLVFLKAEDGSWRAEKIETLRSRSMFFAVAAADFDGDGRDDLATGFLTKRLEKWITGIDILYSRPEGWERRVLAVEEHREGIWSLATGDVDGDGARDLVGLTGDGNPWIFLGDGAGWFTREDAGELEIPGPRCTGFHVALADLDRDGTDEMIAGFAGEEGSEVMLPQVYERKCPTNGALRAWKVQGSAAADERAAALP